MVATIKSFLRIGRDSHEREEKTSNINLDSVVSPQALVWRGWLRMWPLSKHREVHIEVPDDRTAQVRWYWTTHLQFM